MTRKDAVSLIVIPLVYVGFSVAFYVGGHQTLLSVLAIPRSIPLMALSGLIFHAANDGEQVLYVGKVAGVILNVGIYYYDILRRRHI